MLTGLLLLCIAGLCQWNGNPAVNSAVCNVKNGQRYPQAIPDGNGGAFVCWQDARAGGYYSNIYAQHFDKNGVKLWAKNGLAVDTGNYSDHPRIATDGNGGIIVAWADHRNATGTHNQESDIFAQRVNAAGKLQWVGNGVAVDSNADVKARIGIVSDGNGGVYLAWDEFYNNQANLIFGQHVRGDGSLAWGTLQYATRLCYITSYYAYEPQLVTDGKGGMIVTWFDDRDGTDNIYAQHYDSLANRKWDYNDLVVCQADYDQQFPGIISDNGGGAIIVWNDNRTGFSGPTYDVYAQKINAAGVKQWLSPSDPWYNNNGIPISTAQYRQFLPQLTSDSAGGAYFAWADEAGNYGLTVQRVRQDGSTVFPANGEVLNYSVVYPGAILFSSDANKMCMMTDTAGNAVIVWSDKRGGYAYDIYGQKIDSTGNKLWGANDVPISTAQDVQDRPVIVPSQYNNGIVFWEDNRNAASTDADIYTSLLTAEGTLPVALVGLKGDYVKSQVQLQWETTNELNNNYFEIQRSNNSSNFQPIGRVQGAGSSSSLQHYSFADASPGTGNIYYRLKQVDMDGKFSFSNIILIKASNAPIVSVYPNPAAHYITINMAGTAQADRVVIYNMQGQAVKQWEHTTVNKQFDISQLAAGQYTVSIYANKGVSTSRLIVQP